MPTFVRIGDRIINLDAISTVHVAKNPNDPDRPSRATVDYVHGGHVQVDGADDVGALLNAVGQGNNRRPQRSEDI